MIPLSDLYRRLGGQWAAVLVVVGLALILRCLGLPHHRLWYDELLSANFSAHGPLTSLLAVRVDPHPPLYYLQLSLWALASRSDGWLMVNSIVWSVVAVAALTVFATRLYGARTGLLAGALLAVSPAALAYADQVRMYALISALVIFAWYAQERWVRGASRRWLWALAAFELAIVYTHSIGLLMISGLVVLGAIETRALGDRRKLLEWAGAQAVIGLLSLPVLALGMAHKVGHTHSPGLGDLLATWSFVSTGTGGPEPWRFDDGGVAPWRAALAAAVFGLLAWAAVTTPKARWRIVSLVLAPMLVVALLSYALKPIWLNRVFVSTTPFLALALAQLAAEPRPRARSWPLAAVCALAAAWLAIGVLDQTTRAKGDGYAAAADYVRATARPGDVVEMSDAPGLWAFLWRYAGPNWGDPLRARFPDPPKWAALEAKLPAPVRERIQPGRLDWDEGGVRFVLHDPMEPPPWAGGDLITVSTAGAWPAVPGATLSERLVIPPLVIDHWKRVPAAKSAVGAAP